MYVNISIYRQTMATSCSKGMRFVQRSLAGRLLNWNNSACGGLFLVLATFCLMCLQRLVKEEIICFLFLRFSFLKFSSAPEAAASLHRTTRARTRLVAVAGLEILWQKSLVGMFCFLFWNVLMSFSWFVQLFYRERCRKIESRSRGQ